jgi:RNA polymerase sigma factor (sigma-70 family)
MPELPTTRATLLVRLADERDVLAWNQFVAIYAPLVFQLARRRGLQDADAADVTQEVLGSVADAFRRKKFDRSRGTFRGWLFRIARNEVATLQAARARRHQPEGGSAADVRLQQIADSQEPELWEAEYHQRLFAWAKEQVQREVEPSTWQAFRLTALEVQSGQQVAATTGLSVAAVYLAKSRVMKRLREIVQQVDEELE